MTDNRKPNAYGHVVPNASNKSIRSSTLTVPSPLAAETGEEIMTLRGHTSTVTSVAFSPDGARVATGSWDNTVKLWDGTPRSDGAAPQPHE